MAADTVTNQILENGFARLVVKVTDFSTDGAGLTNYKAVDAQSPDTGVFWIGQQFVPGTSLVLTGLWWNVIGMVLRMQWEATVNQELLDLQGYGEWGFRDIRGGFGGLANPKSAGATGSILFTTVGASAGSSCSVIMEFVKGLQVPLPVGGGGDLLLESGDDLLLETGDPILLEG